MCSRDRRSHPDHLQDKNSRCTRVRQRHLGTTERARVHGRTGIGDSSSQGRAGSDVHSTIHARRLTLPSSLGDPLWLARERERARPKSFSAWPRTYPARQMGRSCWCLSSLAGQLLNRPAVLSKSRNNADNAHELCERGSDLSHRAVLEGRRGLGKAWSEWGSVSRVGPLWLLITAWLKDNSRLQCAHKGENKG